MTSKDRRRSYTVAPLQVFGQDPATIEKCNRILNAFLGHRNFFTGYIRSCEEECGECADCLQCKKAVAQTLLAPKSISWEVWRLDSEGSPVDLVGILRLSRIEFGCDALAHFFFFDSKLRDKEPLLERWGQWIFSDHPPSQRLPDGWRGLKRLTVEIPSYAAGLARHASQTFGFGGPFEYEIDGRRISVEGVKRNVKPKDGEWFDLLILGIQRDDVVDAS